MAKEKKDVKKSDSSPDDKDVKGKAAPSPVDVPPVEEPTPAPQGQEGVVEPVEEPIEEPVIKDDRDVENQIRELTRKSDEAQSKYQTLLETTFDIERDREAQRTPVVPAEVESLYAEAEELGFTRNWVDGMFRAQQAQNAAQMENFRKQNIQPYVDSNVENSNKREVRYLVQNDSVMAPYESEVMDLLRSPLWKQARHDADAPFQALKIVKGEHVDDIIKAGTSNARKEAAMDRKIISNAPSSTTVTLEGGQTVELTAEQKKICAKTGITEEQYAEDLLKHRARQGSLPPREMMAE